MLILSYISIDTNQIEVRASIVSTYDSRKTFSPFYHTPHRYTFLGMGVVFLNEKTALKAQSRGGEICEKFFLVSFHVEKTRGSGWCLGLLCRFFSSFSSHQQQSSISSVWCFVCSRAALSRSPDLLRQMDRKP